MTELREKIEEARSRILTAFGKTSYPGDGHLLHELSTAAEEVEEFRGLTNWKAIPAEVLTRNNGSLAFFSPEAFRFYLPAYMLHALDHFAEGEAEVDNTIYCLEPPAGDLLDYWRSRVEALDRAQREAVVAFLEAVSALDHESDRLLRGNAEAGLRYWRGQP